jgi:hypothetical protein
MLSPYTRVLKDNEPGTSVPEPTPDATQAFVESALPAPARKPVRLRKADLVPGEDAPR